MGNRPFSRRGFILGAGAAVPAAGVSRAGPAEAALGGTGPVAPATVVHFQADGGISGCYLAGQLAGNGQSIGSLAFVTSAAGGNLELLARGGAGTFVKLGYLDGGGAERTGLAVSAASGALRFTGRSGTVTTIAAR